MRDEAADARVVRGFEFEHPEVVQLVEGRVRARGRCAAELLVRVAVLVAPAEAAVAQERGDVGVVRDEPLAARRVVEDAARLAQRGVDRVGVGEEGGVAVVEGGGGEGWRLVRTWQDGRGRGTG
ncbi:hypothetical protein GTY68_05350 [Streptomyces sp. SID4926]|nr:hypothetical protein [Streptomyces sp. SID4926]